MLPIEAVLGEIRAAIQSNGRVVLEAPPGAGKTTRVPPLLLDLVPGEVWVLEPRRLAARMAAARVAQERGTVLGEEVGYQVRFDERASGKTRLRFVTEAILTRRPTSPIHLCAASRRWCSTGEFHERHIHTDIALALAARRAKRSEASSSSCRRLWIRRRSRNSSGRRSCVAKAACIRST